MITAQDIREKTFEKSTFGGYAMNEVDDFLDELADDLAVSQKETAVLKSKMKVLVNKIEEYRGSEDAMHLALVSAQKIAKEIEDDARAKADALLADAQARSEKIVADAQAEAERITGDLSTLREREELRYQAAKTAAADYIQKAKLMLEREQSFFTSLEGELDVADAIVTPAPAEKKAIAAPAEEEAEPVADDLQAFMDAVYPEKEEEALPEETEEDPLF